MVLLQQFYESDVRNHLFSMGTEEQFSIMFVPLYANGQQGNRCNMRLADTFGVQWVRVLYPMQHSKPKKELLATRFAQVVICFRIECHALLVQLILAQMKMETITAIIICMERKVLFTDNTRDKVHSRLVSRQHTVGTILCVDKRIAHRQVKEFPLPYIDSLIVHD